MFLLHAEIKSRLSQRAHLHIRMLQKNISFYHFKTTLPIISFHFTIQLLQWIHSIKPLGSVITQVQTEWVIILMMNPSFQGFLTFMFIMLETFTTYVSMITKMSMQNFLLLITQMRLSQLESLKVVVKIQISMRTWGWKSPKLMQSRNVKFGCSAGPETTWNDQLLGFALVPTPISIVAAAAAAFKPREREEWVRREREERETEEDREETERREKGRREGSGWETRERERERDSEWVIK